MNDIKSQECTSLSIENAAKPLNGWGTSWTSLGAYSASQTQMDEGITATLLCPCVGTPCTLSALWFAFYPVYIIIGLVAYSF